MTFQDPRRLITRRRFHRTDADRAEFGDVAGVAPVRRIVLTGGPGSGKSTAASFLAREFVDELWVLPESATLLYKGGLPRADSSLGQQVAQRAIYTVQRSLEAATQLRHPDRVQLCDRSTLDGAAYWPAGPDDFFGAMNTTRERELARYDAIIFLQTAAHLPAGYERDMDIRTEGADEAIELDRRVQELYADHPSFVLVPSSASFLDKLITVRNTVAQLISGAPDPDSDPTERAERPTFFALSGDATETSVDVAPISSLMGLASVGHVLPVE